MEVVEYIHTQAHSCVYTKFLEKSFKNEGACRDGITKK